jgi:hypothetical protein
VTIIDSDKDGYVNQKEAEASISGLSFASGDDTALITERSYSSIVATLDDDDAPRSSVRVTGDADDDADVEIKVQGDVDVKEEN